MTQIIHVVLDVQGIDAGFWVNDIPVGALRYRRSLHLAVPIHEYLVNGENTLRIVRTDPPAEGETQRAEELVASMTVAGFAVGARPGIDPGDVMSTLRLRVSGSPAQGSQTAQGSFRQVAWPHLWVWQSLPAYDWSGAKAAAQVAQYLRTFADRFQLGDVAWLLAALLPKMSDYCTAYGLDLRAESAELAARMARRLADPSFKMTPFADADLVLQPCAKGRLVDCTLKSGETAIRWHDARAGDRGAMLLRLGYADRALRVFR